MADSYVEASETLEFATHLLQEWKAGFDPSELDTSIFLLEECLGSHPSSDVHRIDILIHLLNARLTRFACTSNEWDLREGESYLEKLESAVNGLTEFNFEITTADMNLDKAAGILAEFRQSANMATLETVIFLHHHALSLWGHASPTRWKPLNGLCDALSLRLLHSRDEGHLSEYTSKAQALCALEPSYDHHYTIAIAVALSLGIGTHTRSRDMSALLLWNAAVPLAKSGESDAAIIKFAEAADLLGQHDPQRPALLATWAVALKERFHANNRPADLDESITQHRRALSFPTWEGRILHMGGLAEALLLRFHFSGQESDLDDAIALYREALPQLTGAGLRRPGLLELARTLQQRCKLTQQLQDANAGIILLSELESDYALSALEKGQCLAMRANMLDVRYTHLSDDADLEAAIRYRVRSLAELPTSDDNRCAVLAGLASGLTLRFMQHANPADIHRAVELIREASDTWPEGRPQKDACIFNMATILHERFDFLGDVADLDKSIELHGQVLKLRPIPHFQRYESLINLSNALSARFLLYRRTSDRERAAEMYRDALSLLKDSNSPHIRSFGDNNLSCLLTMRFEELDMAADLDITEAVKLASMALDARSQRHPKRVTAMANLAHALCMRFRMEGDITDMNKAIELLRAAQAAHKGAIRPRLLLMLANFLLERHKTTGEEEDVQAAIATCDCITAETVDLPNNPQRRFTLTQVDTIRAEVLLTLYEQTQNERVLRSSLSLTRSVVDSLPKEQIHYGAARFNLSRALIHTYNSQQNPIHLNEAIACLRLAAENTVVPLHIRLDAATYWASSTEYIRPTSALTAYEYAIGLLPRIAMAGHDLRGRNRALQSSSRTSRDGLGRKAAACAIYQGQFEKAVELLETARSVFWSQALQLRPPLEDLRHVEPGLATRLANIANQLEKGSMRDTSRGLLASGSPELLRLEEESSRYRKLNDEWINTLHTVRKLPGYQNFLRPQPIAELKQAARYGPVVILNTSERGCHALIVTKKDVQCVPLREMKPDYLTTLATSVRAITQGRPVDALQLRALAPDSTFRLNAGREGAMDPNEIFGLVLRRLWEWVVQPVLDSLKLKRTKMPPRLWWCPTGAFTVLPIHAAGVYNADGDCVSDYVISSYTPNLTLLLRPFSSTRKPFKMTTIIQPDTPGSPLPSTIQELEIIKTRVPRNWLNTLGDSAVSPANINTVLLHLASSAIVHFACHGHQDHLNPLESALLLENGERLKMSQIMQIRPADGSNKAMSLVFLAACETAQGQDAQPDEAMHVAATLLFVGFGGAVATMWTIMDSDGPKIADTFYEQLFKGSVNAIPDLRNAASALHLAVRKLRTADGKVPFTRWVPFVHFGL